MKSKPASEKKVLAEFKAVIEKLTPAQQESVKSLLATVDACVLAQINKRKLKFSCRDYMRAAAELENDSLQFKFENEDLSPNERLMFLSVTEKAILDELENLKTEALVQDDDLALEYLHRIAQESARQLLTVTRVKLDKASKIAAKQDAWPLPYANDSVTKKAADELVKQLQVGSDRLTTTDPSNVYSENTEARKWVGLFVELIDEVRRKEAWCKKATQALYGKDEVVQETVRAIKSLPNPSDSEDDLVAYHRELIVNLDVSSKFKAVLKTENPFFDEVNAKEFILAAIALPPLTPDKDVVKTWAKVIRKIVTKMHGGFPEKNRSLRWMGMSLAKSNQGVAPENTASYESNVRSGIFQRFENTLKSIAKG